MGLWGIPLLGNFPRLFKNRSRAFITIPSIIIPAFNCLSLAPYLSSKFQEKALGESWSGLWWPVLCISFAVVRNITRTPAEGIASPAGGAGPGRSPRCGVPAGPEPLPHPGPGEPGQRPTCIQPAMPGARGGPTNPGGPGHTPAAPEGSGVGHATPGTRGQCCLRGAAG